MGRGTTGRGYPLYRVPFPSRKQSRPSQKVPLRPPPILSSCHLKTMWTRAYPASFSTCAAASCLNPGSSPSLSSLVNTASLGLQLLLPVFLPPLLPGPLI